MILGQASDPVMTEAPEVTPLDVLKYRLYKEGSLHGQRFTDGSAAHLWQTLYACLWGDDIDYFLRNPAFRPHSADWRRYKNRGTPWSLPDAQKKESAGNTKTGVRKGKICGNYLARGDRCFNCKTCAIDNTSVLCSECFFASDHTGHDVTFGVAYSFSGYCDCGDPSSWSRPTNCPHHPPTENLLEASSSNLVNPPRHVELPGKRAQAIRATLELVLDYIIETFEAGPPEGNVTVPRTIEEVVFETQGAHSLKGKVKLEPVSLILWGDDKHTGKEVTRQLVHATGLSKVDAAILTNELDKQGRVVIETTDNYYRLIHIAQTLAQIDLTVTFQLSSESYREQACGVIIPWLAEICSSHVLDDDLFLRRQVGDVLLIPSKVGSQAPDGRYRVAASRMERLFLVFSRFWRAPRIAWMKVFVRILTADMDYKIALGNTFARMYTYLVDQYLFFDRESELSLLLWGMQLFPVPAIATAAVRDMDILHTLLQVLTSYFTEQFEHQHLRIPPMVVPRIDADVEAFRTKKWQTMFGHLKVMLQSKGVQKILLDQPESFNEVVSFLSLFTSMAPHIRAKTEHIEFESDAWIRALGVSMDLSRVTISLGQVFDRANREGLIRAITEVGLHISYNSRLLSTVLDSDKFFPPKHHTVQMFGQDFQVIAHDGDLEWTSIHNPLHWTLAEAIKRLPAMIEREPKQEGPSKTTRKDIVSWATASSPEVTEQLLGFNLQITIENPLRSVAYLAQVRAGLWVRNGIGMRGQLHHYRDHPLRETTYDQDLFLLQFGFCTLDPPLMLASLIDRFGLTELFAMPVWPAAVENAQILQLLEELLLCLVTLFTETWAMQTHSRIDTTKREIVHILALGPLAFSDLVKRLSERTVEIASFKDVLEEVATLRVPKGVTETGVYELKSRYYDDVNPLFYHYSRNQQNNVYEILCKQRKTDCINPPVPRLSLGLPFSALHDVFETPFIMLACHIVLHNVIEMRNRSLTAPSAPAVPQMDGLIDLAFHLTTLAILCAPANSSTLACAKPEQLDLPPLITELCDIELDKNWSPYRPRISNLIDLIAQQAPEQVRAFRARLSRDQSTVSADEARKAAIAKRKQAIMAGFAQNQVAFAEAYDVGEEDEDEGGEQIHSYGQCIVCQEACTDQRPSGLLAIVQPSKVVRNMCVGRDWLEECLRVPETLNGDTRVTRYGLGTGDRPMSTDAYPRTEQRFGLNIAVCGHMMHELCLEKFFDDTRLRQHQQGQRNHPENVFRKEFVCPLCKSVGNILVPLTTASEFPPNPGYAPLNEWIRRTLDEDLKRTGKRPKSLKTHSRTGERATWYVDVAGEAETGFLDPGQGAILIRYIMLVMAISEQTTHLSGRTEKGLYVPQDVVAYTLSLMEIAQRGIAPSDHNTVYLNETSERLLRGMITLLWQEEQTASGEPADPTLNRIAIFSTLLPERFRTKPTSSALLLRDPMTIVIETAALAPDGLQPVVVLCYFAEVIRAMLAITFWARLCLSRSASPVWSRSDVDSPEYKLAMETFPEPRNLILSCFRHTPQLLQEATSALNLLPERDLSKLLYTFTLPFLRRASMLCSAMKTTFPTAGASGLTGEYNQHLRRLRIPPPGSTLLDPGQPIQSTVISWLKQWIQLDTGVPALEYPGIYELYRIPRSLEDLLRFYEKRECTRCGKVPSTPAVCMFCGEYLCLGTDCCSEGSMGECNTHRMECGGAVGMYIDLKRWTTVYLYAGSGSFGPMPFLDCHGELDQGMRRGHPQYQHRARADHVRRTWLGHGIPSFVARKLELTLDQSGWDSL